MNSDNITGHDGYMYVLRKRKIYRLNRNGVGIQRGFPKNIRQVYNRAPINAGAAVYDGRNLYMFKGNYNMYLLFLLFHGILY